MVKNDIDVQKTPQISNKTVKELITLQREYVQNCEKFFAGGDRKKKQLAKFLANFP